MYILWNTHIVRIPPGLTWKVVSNKIWFKIDLILAIPIYAFINALNGSISPDVALKSFEMSLQTYLYS